MMNGKNNKQKRDLAEDEARVLRLIQDMYGRNNKPSECFQAKDGDMVIFVKDQAGHCPIMVNLTFVADLAKEQNLQDQDIKEEWLTPG